MIDPPVMYNDPKGDCSWCIGALVGAATEVLTQVVTNAISGKELTDIDWVDVGVATVAGDVVNGKMVKAADGNIAKAQNALNDATGKGPGGVKRYKPGSANHQAAMSRVNQASQNLTNAKLDKQITESITDMSVDTTSAIGANSASEQVKKRVN
ncbi:hypothetical protein [Chondrinema litorale]|uniref:hypothetical protein n=1 Tax=Chondrinema litorale TaxID=2994555 RepID=UPI002543053F|nr:hypothetical protein [Chondrinema litorale]UZR99102.1 hypothetical protein OQ292_35115 [Chondrinema litorale]